MATGTTQNHVRTRNGVVEAALRRVGAVKPGEAASYNMMREAIRDLNDILREEDLNQTGLKKSLWALSQAHIFLEEDHFIYSSTDGLPDDILDLQDVKFRDLGGEDNEVAIITPAEYEAKTPKDQVGDVQCVILDKQLDIADQTLKIWPCPDAFNDDGPDEVTGTDTLNYTCVKGHTASAETRPITGSSWSLFWTQTGSSGSTWVTDTEYESDLLLRLNYKRPLFDFDDPNNDPDMPLGWSSYLLWRLCLVLGAGDQYKVSDGTYQRFERELARAETKLFPTKITPSTTYHNKTRFF